MILEGIPHGLRLSQEMIDRDLTRRQCGYGRGGRMKLEHDRARVVAGLRHGVTLGSPIAIEIVNENHQQQWSAVMSPFPPPRAVAEVRMKRLTRPRPGHADLAGAMKMGARDMREVLERASARETAARVAAGAVARALLAELDVRIGSHVVAVGGASLPAGRAVTMAEIEAMEGRAAPLRCVDEGAEERMRAAVDEARAAGDTLGGVFEVVAATPPPGLGSHTHWDLRLDGRLAQALMSIPAIKAVEIGAGVSAAGLPGSAVHDAIHYDPKAGIQRRTNRAGGTEGGMTNGEELRIRAYKKPIATMRRPIESIDIATKEAATAAYERSDVTAVPAAAVIGEAMVALILAQAALDKFAGDSMTELCRAHQAYLADLKAL